MTAAELQQNPSVDDPLLRLRFLARTICGCGIWVGHVAMLIAIQAEMQ